MNKRPLCVVFLFYELSAINGDLTFSVRRQRRLCIRDSFCTALSGEQLLALATSSKAAGGADDPAQADAVLHLPGPLLSLVGGADEIKVTASTVGEALAVVAGTHSAFAAMVFPGGQVAEAFLITVGDDDIRNLGGLSTPVTPGTDITIVMAMSGG